MSLGWGIFLSSLLLAPILLYSITKDRWKWRAFGKWLVVALLAIAVLATGIYAASLVHFPLAHQIGRQTAYAGIKLGTSAAEVKYLRGAPSGVFAQNNDDPKFKGLLEVIPQKEIPKGKHVEDYGDWYYEDTNTRLDLRFDKPGGSLTQISCYSSDHPYTCPDLEGIQNGATEYEVINKFGQPDTSVISDTTKKMQYKKQSVFFFFERERVYLLGIAAQVGTE